MTRATVVGDFVHTKECRTRETRADVWMAVDALFAQGARSVTIYLETDPKAALEREEASPRTGTAA